MRKPVYHHPDFVTEVDMKGDNEKRYWLKLTFDPGERNSIIVILKNPSRATKEVSDKTIYTVTKYIYLKRNTKLFKDIGSIIILNLIPYYETNSVKLIRYGNIIDKANIDTVRLYTSKISRVIIAWGNPPNGLKAEYEELKSSVFCMLREYKNDIHFIDKLSKLGNPKHGQVWTYNDSIKKMDKE